ncbi:hypothetical protein GCM10023093_26580 [Nemorincola caseinilytica]|uniref:Secretion system C-terminal sorting domain-containing protein n=1 Tax=Nemorincola caseinilytica TaxID=2054315 RepID=A0ABP8NK16_9BACT
MNKKRYSILFLVLIALVRVSPAGAQYITTFTGTGQGYAGDGGPAAMARLNTPAGMAVDGAGNIYIADAGNNVVRKIDATGIISTFAGTGVSGYSGNGGAATLAKLNSPVAIATDAAGNVYIADNGNHLVRVVNVSGFIKNYAGNGIAGYAGDGDTAHLGSLKLPQSIAIDAVGNMYISEAGNHVIRKVSAGDRIMSTVAGTGIQGNSGDGGAATNAQLSTPAGIAVDAAGNIYVADLFNNRIRKVTASTGTIATIVGTGAAGNSGNGGPATAASLRYPSSVSLDVTGNLYLTDQGNNNVRMVNGAGIISNVAGTSTNGYAGDGGLAVNAKLNSPKAVFVDGWGRIYIVDQGNHVIRKLTNEPGGVAAVVPVSGFSIYPNPAQSEVYLAVYGIKDAADVTICDMTGRVVASQHMAAAPATHAVSTAALPGGIYTVVLHANGSRYVQKLVIEGK